MLTRPLIPSQPVFAFSPLCCVLSEEAIHTNFIDFGCTRSGLDPTIKRTRCEHANHYTIDVFFKFDDLMILTKKSHKIKKINCIFIKCDIMISLSVTSFEWALVRDHFLKTVLELILFLSNMIIRSFLCKLHDNILTIQNLKLKSDFKVHFYLQHFSIISLRLIRFLNNTCLIMNYSNYVNLDIFINMFYLQYHYSFKEWCLHIEFIFFKNICQY